MVPAEIGVTFCDDMYSFSFVVPGGASPDDVLRMYWDAI